MGQRKNERAHLLDEGTQDVASKNQEAGEKAGTAVETRWLKVLHTINMCFAYSTSGIMTAMFGVAFLDLIEITKSDIQTGSFIFVLCGLGAVLGSGVFGVLSKRVPGEMLLATSLVLAGVLTAVLPHVTSFPAALFVTGSAWLFVGLMETVVVFLVNRLWNEDEGPYTQAVYFSHAVGGIIGPLITEPYLGPDTSHNIPSSANTSLSGETLLPTTSQIHVPFLITGAVHVTFALPWVFLSLRRILCNLEHRNRSTVEKHAEKQVEEKSELSLKTKIFLLVCAGMFYVSFEMAEDGIPRYLTTIVNEKLNWTKVEGSRLTTVFWGSFICGKAAGIGLAHVVPVFHLLLASLLGLNASLVLWICVFSYHKLASWLCVTLIGLFMSPIFPCGITFVHTYMSSGVVSTVTIGSSNAADALYPIMIGQLLAFAYPMTSIVAFTTVCVLSMFIIIMMRLTLKPAQVV